MTVWSATGGGMLAVAGCLFLATGSSAQVSDHGTPKHKQAIEDATAFQIDAAHDGTVAFKRGFSAPLKQAWIVNLGGPVSYPVTANGMVFVTVGNVGNPGSQLYALDIKTGKTIWQKQVGSTSDDFSNVTYEKGQIFLLNSAGNLQGITADKRGKLNWTVQVGSIEAAPTAAGGLVYVAGEQQDGLVLALDETTGTVAWGGAVEFGQQSAPAVGDKGVYVSYPCEYYKFGAPNGRLDWHDNTGCFGGGGATPVYDNQQVYIRDVATGDWILDAATGEIVGQFNADETPTFWKSTNGDSYEISLSGTTLSATDTVTGSTVWSFTGDDYLSSPPIVVNDLVVEGSLQGNLYLLDPSTGSQVWTTNVGASIEPGEQPGIPWTGLGAGENTLLVPASDLLAAYVPK
jgi:eukaryotic-like serine/threonine-protein kinase